MDQHSPKHGLSYDQFVCQTGSTALRQLHPSQVFHMRQDGRVEMRFETTGRKQVVRWIHSWMPDVKVLAPKSLRDRVCEKLEAGLRSQ